MTRFWFLWFFSWAFSFWAQNQLLIKKKTITTARELTACSPSVQYREQQELQEEVSQPVHWMQGACDRVGHDTPTWHHQQARGAP